MEKLDAYFYEHILLPLVRYEEIKNDGDMGSGRDLRASLDVATALYHFRERIPHPHQRSRAAIASVCPDYDLLGDVVNATKHANLTQGSPQILSADDIFEVHVITKYEDDQGEYVHQEKRVVAKLTDGTERDLFDILIKVYDLWVQKLHAIGGKRNNKRFSNPPLGLNNSPLRSEWALGLVS